MVAVGWAIADRHVTDAYVPYENQARTQKQWLWAGKFIAPWTYRQKVTNGQKNQAQGGFLRGLFK